jgi:Ca-activated chloride channel family protein
MKQQRMAQSSFAISAALHVGFLFLAMIWFLPGAKHLITETKKMFDLHPVTIESGAKQKLVQSYIENLKNPDPDSKSRAAARIAPVQVEDLKSPNFEKAFDNPKMLVGGSAPYRPNVPQNRLKEHNPSAPRILAQSAPSQHVVSEATSSAAALNSAIETPGAIGETMFAFTPQKAGVQDPVYSMFAGLGPGDGTGQRMIDDLIQVKVATYQDPADGEKYYQISISPGKDADKLEVMPKEVIFLMDASLSIQKDRLDQFIRGIQYAVTNLNPGDRYNIYTFKDKITALAPKPIEKTRDGIKETIWFLNKLESSERTDIYEAFLETIQKKASMNPSYIIFLSDGRPTQGILSTTRLITEIARINHKSRSIFSFSGGSRVNRYLLDFLSYQNRGWSEYALKTNEIKKRISELYDKIRNPLLINVNYQLSGLKENESFPRDLPDFYRDTAFVIYGKFTAEDKFSVRVVGEINGEMKEFIFSRSMAEAETGTKDIAVNWAFNKFYHHLSRITLDGPNDEDEREIRSLSKKFGIQNPYEF